MKLFPKNEVPRCTYSQKGCKAQCHYYLDVDDKHFACLEVEYRLAVIDQTKKGKGGRPKKEE